MPAASNNGSSQPFRWLVSVIIILRHAFSMGRHQQHATVVHLLKESCYCTYEYSLQSYEWLETIVSSIWDSSYT